MGQLLSVDLKKNFKSSLAFHVQHCFESRMTRSSQHFTCAPTGLPAPQARDPPWKALALHLPEAPSVPHGYPVPMVRISDKSYLNSY